MADTFETLLEKTSLEKITISQIAEEGGIARNTIYYHFKDKYDIVRWIHEEEKRNWPSIDTGADALENFHLNFAYMCIRKKDLFRNLTKGIEQNSLMRILGEAAMEDSRKIVGKEADAEILYKIARLYVMGTLDLYREWIQAGFPDTPEKIAHAAYLATPACLAELEKKRIIELGEYKNREESAMS